jgi:hypothetical protein
MKRIILAAMVLVASCCSPASDTSVFTTESGLEYKIRVEFVLPIEYKTKYPFIARAFEDAVAEWARHIPIDPVFIPNRVYGRPRVIDVHIVPNPVPGSPLGLYYPTMKTLFLNSISLLDYDDAYDVALHEIGHAFGLKHVGDLEMVGGGILTGDVVIVGDPKEYLMYPYYSPENEGAGISDLDIELAREYLKRLAW